MKTFLIAALLVLASLGAKAQIPVTDLASVVQNQINSTAQLAELAKSLAEQIRQYQVMYSQLQQAQQAYQAVMGGRGMDVLLGGQLDPYLPADITGLRTMAQSARSVTMASGAQGKLMSASYALNSVLPPAALAALPANEREVILNARDSTAIASSSADLAYSRAQQRITHLRALQAAIPTATDPAARAELANAIAIDQAMIANEQNQLLALAQSNQADALAMQRRAREQQIKFGGTYADYRVPVL